MAGFQKTLSGAATHLRQMTLSQRVAILLGVALVAGSLAWMVQWAATPQMVPLLNQRLSADDLARVTAGLDMMKVHYKADATQVYVPASANRADLLARLQQGGSMPSDTSIGFAELVRESNPWISQAENNRRWTLALQNELERVLASFAGVERASVFLNLDAQRAAFSRNRPKNSASATITMRGGLPVPRELAVSAAQLISGAVRGLPRNNVQVLDSNGRPAIHWDAEEDGSISELARRQRSYEKEITNKILSQLDFVPDVKVSVQVVLNRTASTIDAADVKEGTKIDESVSEQQSRQATPAAQPGVQPNVGVAAGAAAPAGTSETRSETTRSFQPSVQKTLQTTPAGGVKQSFAAISVSDQFLAAVFKRGNPDVDQPTEQQLEQTFEKQKDRIAAQVAKLVYPPDPEQIAMSWHYSAIPPAAATQADSASVTMDLAGRYGPAAGLGVLALGSLFLMMRMAKQSGDGEAFGMEIGLPKEAIAAARRAAKDVARSAAAGSVASGASTIPAAGEVTTEPVPPEVIPMGAAADGVLEAQEVTEDVAEINKMLEQVAAHVAENEEGVAALVERWAER